MAAYTKLFTTVSDHAIGKQSVNVAIDNNQALYDQLDLNHSMGLRGGDANDPFLQFGQHDDPLIARTVLSFAVTTAPLLLTLLGGPMLVGSPVRIGTGTWMLRIATPTIFFAVATPRAASALDYFANARLVFDPAGPGVMVTTWNAGAGVLLDMDFDVAIWAEGLI
ncbi:MAG: hypothetical protein JNM17_13225 [Archangium sp.]|nr:hypothetical protein [Archangium sp.]